MQLLNRQSVLHKLFLIFFILTPFIGLGQITVLHVNFDSSTSFPSGWTQSTVVGNETWGLRNGGFNPGAPENYNHPTSANSGSSNAYYHRNNTGTTKANLITPKLDLTGLGNVTLTFYEARLKWGSANDYLKVFYRTSSSSSWVQVGSYTSATSGWTKRTISLPKPSSTYYVAFQAVGRYGYGVCLDDIKITAEIAYDAGITGFRMLDKKFMQAQIKNYGADDLKSTKIFWSSDTISLDSFSYSGSMVQDSQAWITIDTFSFAHGTHNIKLWTSKPNNKDDGDHSNDTFETTYTIIRTFPYSESFENGDGHFSQATDDDIDWTRNKKFTYTSGTGPTAAKDQTWYYYIESTGFKNHRADLVSPDLDLTAMTHPYLEFWYNMYAHPQAGKMGTLTIFADSNEQWVSLFSKTGNQGTKWNQALISLENKLNLNNLNFSGTTASYYSDMAFDLVRLFDYPQVNFSDTLIVCNGDIIDFKADSGVDYHFAWINLTTGDTLSQSATLQVDSTLNFIVRIESSYGYFAADTVQVLWRPKPVVAFTMNDSTACLNQNVFKFNNQSNIASGNMNYYWDFGNDSSSTLTNPEFSYPGYGQFKVKLICTSDDGCSDSVQKNLVVYESPIASKSIISSEACFKSNYLNLASNATISSDTLVNYIWYFGDGDSSLNDSVLHKYMDPGTYQLKHIVATSQACTDTLTFTWTVKPQPQVAFSVPDSIQCFDQNSFSFKNTSKDSSSALTFYWDFNDGSSSTLENPVKSFSNADSFIIKLVATNSSSCTDSAKMQVIVHPSPLANFKLSDTVACFNTHAFVTQNKSSISAGSLDYLWNNGSGSHSTQQNDTFIYSKTGMYLISLKATSAKGCSDSAAQWVTINESPKAMFSLSDTSACLNDNQINFISQSTATEALSYKWFLGDGASKPDSSFNYSYANEGSYDVTLIATTPANCSDTASKTIHIYPNPKVQFSLMDSNVCQKSTVGVLNQTSISSGSLNYVWTGSAGSQSKLENPVFSFADTGIVTLKLVSTSDQGCSDSLIKNFHVWEVPMASFVMTDSNLCFNNHQLIAQNSSSSTINIINNSWYLDASKISDKTNLSVKAQQPGKYVLSLVIENEKHCSDSTSVQVNIYENPTAGFTINDSMQCLNENNFIFTNTSSISSGQFTSAWTAGKDFNTMENWSTHFKQVGKLMVQLVTTSNEGCSDSLEKSIEILPSPTLDLGADTVLKSWQSITLDAGAGNAAYEWSDGTTKQTLLVKAQDLSLQDDNYFWVSVTNQEGCSAIDSINIKIDTTIAINDLANPNFTIYPNPSKGKVIIQNPSNILIKSIEVTDIYGRFILSKNIDAAKSEIILNLNELDKAGYILKVNTATQFYIRKIVLIN